MTITAALLVAIVIGLVEAIKRVGLSARWLPLVSLALGVSLSLTVLEPGRLGIVTGLVIGLTAVGLFSAGKNTLTVK